MKVALVIGHKKTSYGACNKSICEFQFNEKVAKRVAEQLDGINHALVYRTTYKKLPALINRTKADFFVSFHCNSFDTVVSGTETLYHHRSKSSKRLAIIVQDFVVNALTLRDRGIKPVTTEDKGGYLLRYTRMPGVIAEPFFIDNCNDLKKAQDNFDSLVAGYAAAILEYASS